MKIHMYTADIKETKGYWRIKVKWNLKILNISHGLYTFLRLITITDLKFPNACSDKKDIILT